MSTDVQHYLYVSTLTNLVFRLIRESGLKIYPFDGLDEAAAKAVQLGRA